VKAYVAALRACGVRIVDKEYPFLMHGGFNFGAYVRAADTVLREVGALARSELDKRAD
jgi:hypothetical protein